MKKIEEKELLNLQTLNNEFNKLKVQLGDLTLQKHGLCLRVEELKASFQTAEKALIDKYGANSVINLETGEVKDTEEKVENGENK